ncbi:MAG: hypothetical protein GY870_01260 [archaeon]|nr:hypothetical protein [archaeon]
MSLSIFDLIFMIVAVSFYLLIISLFVFVKKNRMDLVKKLGILISLLALPMIFVFIGYLNLQKEINILLGLIIILVYFLVEFLLDIVFKFNFRDKSSTHVPYILLFYVTSMSFIVIAFDIGAIYGWIVSILFWGFLGAVIYLYWGKKEKKV